MFLGPKGSYHVLIADTATHKLIGEIPLTDAPRPIALSKDGTRFYANVDTLIGFEVADVPSRKPLYRVEADVPAELLRKASRSHGIGLTPDEKELWMCDVYHDRTYVFDLTISPPKQVATIVMQGGGYWMDFSPDGKRCYISERVGNTVAVIDTASRETVRPDRRRESAEAGPGGHAAGAGRLAGGVALEKSDTPDEPRCLVRVQRLTILQDSQDCRPFVPLDVFFFSTINSRIRSFQ